MNNAQDSSLVPNEHYEALQMDLKKRGNRANQSSDSESSSLREFNAELLARIGEFRKKNLELAASENTLRIALAAQEKQQSDLERTLAEKFRKEVDQLSKSLGEIQITSSRSSEEWNRKFAKLSDEKWSLELEVDSLRQTNKEHEKASSELEQELARVREELRMANEAARESAHQIDKLNQNLAMEKKNAADLEEAVQFGKNALQEAVETSRVRETQMMNAYEALRVEYTNMDKCYHDANNNVLRLREDILKLKNQHEIELNQLQERLTREFVTQSETLFTENAQLRENLAIRDTRNDAERTALQTLREQLNYLDQHLRQTAEKTKKDKAELWTSARNLAEELEFALTHPFTEYLEIAELEIVQLEKQFAATSNISPARSKLQTRLEQAKAHRDGIDSILKGSNTEIAQHLERVRAILENFANEKEGTRR